MRQRRCSTSCTPDSRFRNGPLGSSEMYPNGEDYRPHEACRKDDRAFVGRLRRCKSSSLRGAMIRGGARRRAVSKIRCDISVWGPTPERIPLTPALWRRLHRGPTIPLRLPARSIPRDYRASPKSSADRLNYPGVLPMHAFTRIRAATYLTALASVGDACRPPRRTLRAMLPRRKGLRPLRPLPLEQAG